MDLIAYVLASPFFYVGLGVLFLLYLAWPNIVAASRLRQAENEAVKELGDALISQNWDMAYFPPEKGGEGMGQMFVRPDDNEDEYLLAWTLRGKGQVEIDHHRDGAVHIPRFLALPPERQWYLLTHEMLVHGEVA